MIGYIEYLAKFSAPIAMEHQIDLILQYLNNSYSQFVMNYNINEIDKNLTELLAMLKTVETNIQKASPAPMLMVNKGKAKGKDTGCDSHICINMQELQGSRTLEKGEVDLRVGSGTKECGIVSQLTPPGTPQWNGVSERRNHTLLYMVRSMMCLADLPISFWGYALETAAYTLN
ncbi:hypothetical protein AgCh_000580 [Apium graveolens]